MGHQHSHSHDTDNQSDRQLGLAVFINVLLTVAQVVGGVVSGSLSLIADALHNLSDAAAIFIALIARKIGGKPADERYHFGYKRAEILATLLNSTTLIIIGGFLIIEAIESYFNPTPIDGWIVVWVAALALVIDIGTAILTFHAGAKNSMNIRAAFIHNISDAMASIVVIVAGSLIILYQWYIVDLIATILISAYVIYHGVLLLIESCKILMQAAPDDFDRNEVSAALCKQFAIKQVHSLKAWQLDDNQTCCELVLTPFAELVLADVKNYLHDEFAIEHCIIERRE
ncbi:MULTISPECIES: cation diffusion facilitator family transporter [Pseudoalteromonas]|uniref:cation diffusion facilitator family transporter n=1 Tax=Pseudoalteromonas TaxID=53246 RepID=UPI0002E3926E|nr:MULTISPECIES: cation diffusion facilitator family transporter [Pseudoalteromonas]MCF6146723.1 cobalt-zinc-cadmium efflux system protein [Pseudoalteromonas mariniglutinosa NCIMB 1770]TMN73185.1 cation transporter [Pseudoalteromonas sp. S1727]